MKKFKLIWGNWVKKIKKLGIVKMLNYKSEIGYLNDKISKLNKEIIDLKDLNIQNQIERNILDKEQKKILKFENLIELSDKSLKEKITKIKELENQNSELLSKLFNLDLEMKSLKIQIEEYEAQIKDLKSDRYLIRKIKSGKTPNTVKTKVSKPMSANVTRYMRGEHE